MVDFSKIRIYKGSQNGGFEEFICQLARRNVPSNPLEFRRIEGSGGDGGIECYWEQKDGYKIGYQAKYFLKSGQIDWTQIDKSVKQALDSHPTLIRYVVALPCDLTDKRGINIQGKTGWDSWEKHKKKWVSWAAEKNISIVFEAWTASEIVDKLSKPDAQGLKLFWFNIAEFNDNWYKQHITESIARLGERYHPEDHVNVSVQDIVRGIVRHISFVKELLDLRSNLLNIPSTPDLKNDDTVKEIEKYLQKIEEYSKNIADLDIDKSCDVELPIDNLINIKNNISKETSQIFEWCSKKWNDYNDLNKIPYSLRDFQKKIRKYEDKLGEFSKFIVSNQISADRTRFVIISGAAGTGKSHLSAFLAESACTDKRPVFLFNGFDFLVGVHATQKIAEFVHQGHSKEEVFGAINAAGESARVRALIIIDAINEGAGSQYWYSELPAFITAMNQYSYISCIITCREEYEEYAVSKKIHDKAVRLHIRGFTTVEEQKEAMCVYLDKRGISRPATPWLNPEFINPLFLRSAVTALQRDGKTEFPKGLHGTSAIFRYFVEATVNNMARMYPNLGSGLLHRILDSLQKIAKEMVDQKNYNIPFNKAVEIVTKSFQDFTAPHDTTWLDFLIRNGLLHRFPLYNPDPDPLQPVEESICFTFQRFQDHVMAKQLLNDVTDPMVIFKKGGVAAFCIENISQWSGLISALSIIIPEKYGKELIDCIPNKTEKRWSYSIASAFAESIRWRNKDAFTDRTRKLLSYLSNNGIDELSLVLEMSVCEDHPFNSENLLHPILISQKMPKRDSWWSIALTSTFEDHPIYQIINWSLDGAHHVRAGKTHNLAALILAWSFSTTDRNIRDRATKSLVSLIEINPDIFSFLIDKFGKIDDFYILERIYAAAYGAACRNYDEKWITSFAEIAFKNIFAEGKPPFHLRIRDYARGLIDITKSSNCLPEGIDAKLAYPPYTSSPPKLNLKEEDIKKIAEKAGDNTILKSCTGFIGDFGIYEINPGTCCFLNVPLTKIIPLTIKEKYELFKNEVIKPNLSYKQNFYELEKAYNEISLPSIVFKIDNKTEINTIQADLEIKKNIFNIAFNKLYALLSKSEKSRFRKEVLPYFNNSKNDYKPKIFNQSQCRLWVAKRAYNYGWTKTLFEQEASSYGSYSRDRKVVERIGKKYQWLALSELQCRLADNYWVREGFMGSNRIYESPLSIGFERDIDPTILHPDKIEKAKEDHFTIDIMGPEIDLGECEDKDIIQWPFLINTGDSLTSLVYRNASDGKKYTVLYEHRSTSERYLDDDDKYQGYKREEFRFIWSAIVSKAERKKVVSMLKVDENVNIDDWNPLEFIDGPFLLEYPWCFTWKHDEWEKAIWSMEESPKIARLICEYRWESHLDKSMPEGCTVYMPCPWLCNALKLKIEAETSTKYLNNNGQISLICGNSSEGGGFVAVESELFEKYLKENDNECLWNFLSERNTFVYGEIGRGTHRRIEGVAWKQGTGIRNKIWSKDIYNE